MKGLKNIAIKVLLIATALVLLLSPAACTPNYTDKYARDKGLSKEIREITKALPYDEATVKLLDDVAALPLEVQVHPETLKYLKTVSTDGNVNWDEISELNELNHDGDAFTLAEELEYGTDPLKPNPTVKYALDKGLVDYVELIVPMDEKNDSNILDTEGKAAIDTAAELLKIKDISDSAKESNIEWALKKPSEFKSVYDSLKSISDKAFTEFIGFGIDDNILSYINFVSSLADKNFVKYALESKLCIQDRNLTELEKNFLSEPEKYKQQLFNEYISEIEKENPILAKKLLETPEFKTIEIKDVEAVGDTAHIAGFPENELALDSIAKHSNSSRGLIWILYDYEPAKIDHLLKNYYKDEPIKDEFTVGDKGVIMYCTPLIKL